MGFRWRSYAPLAGLRVAAALLALAMVHPDEFFQSQEVMARDALLAQDAALAAQLHVPWEFKLPTPNRSVLFPYLVAGLPYKLLHAAGVPLTGHILLLVPRVLLCSLSFIIDAVLFKCAVALHLADPTAEVLSFASSWPALIFLTRPFSNTFETLVLALCMATLLCVNPHRRVFLSVFHVQTLLLGALLAVGFFTRFTFPFFFLPLGLELVRRQDALLVEAFDKKHEVDKTNGEVPTLPGQKEPWDYTKTTVAMDAEIRTTRARVLLQRRLACAVSIGLQGLVSFAAFSAAIVSLDTWYFRGQFPTTREAWATAVIAPWNNLQYNLDPANLELHGTHPRITHALVNMPMLFGPLVVVFILNLKTARQRLWEVSCVLVPLALISLAPHQEPRFLLPLLVPLHLFHGAAVVNSRWKQAVWGVFSGILAVFFGVLHQGGLLPLLLSLSGSAGASPRLLALPFTGCRFTQDMPTAVQNLPLVFYKTYMPPRFTLAAGAEPWGPNFQVIDLAGGGGDAMHVQLRDRGLATSSELLLVAPASVDVGRVADALGGCAGADAPLSVVGSCFPHVSTEDLDVNKPLELTIYKWTKSASFVTRLWEATASVFSS